MCHNKSQIQIYKTRSHIRANSRTPSTRGECLGCNGLGMSLCGTPTNFSLSCGCTVIVPTPDQAFLCFMRCVKSNRRRFCTAILRAKQLRLNGSEKNNFDKNRPCHQRKINSVSMSRRISSPSDQLAGRKDSCGLGNDCRLDLAWQYHES